MIINIQAFQYTNVVTLMWFKTHEITFTAITVKKVLSLQILFSN